MTVSKVNDIIHFQNIEKKCNYDINSVLVIDEHSSKNYKSYSSKPKPLVIGSSDILISALNPTFK